MKFFSNAIKKEMVRKGTHLFYQYKGGDYYYPRKLRSTPAATAEPITPATLGPIACMSR